MATSPQRDETFVFCIAPSSGLRAIPLSFAAFFLLCATYGAWKVGLSRLSSDLGNDPDLWWLVIGLGVAFAFPIAFFLRLAFPPRSAQGRLQARRDSVSFIPGRVERRFLGEPVIEAAVTPQSKEILLCHSFFQELPDGYRVIIRAVDETEREVRVKFLALSTIDAQQCQEIAEGMSAATGLPVRFVIRRQLTDGTLQETPWIPAPRKAISASGFARLTVVAAPYLGGIAVGYILPRPAIIVAVGGALWLGQMLAILLAAGRATRTKYSTLYWLTTIFTFGATYGFVVVAVAYIFRAH